MHTGGFVTALTLILILTILIHQVEGCSDGQGDAGTGVKDPVAQRDTRQQLGAVVDLFDCEHHGESILQLSWVQSLKAGVKNIVLGPILIRQNNRSCLGDLTLHTGLFLDPLVDLD